MEIRRIVKENWFTKKIPTTASWFTLFFAFFLVLGAIFYLQDFFNAASWMSATPQKIFVQQQYWKLWTTLFAHGSLEHLFSNLFLFLPFAYILNGYFGSILFPGVGLFIGGIINLLVLKSLPTDVSLIGFSGVVYWMGAAWMTLYFLIDQRDKKSKRLLKVIGISLILFFPQTFQQQVSYLAHGIGFASGVICSLIYYKIYEKKFNSAEVMEFYVYDPDEIDWQNQEAS